MVPSRQQARTLSRGLGWFSIGLGLMELLAARRLARRVGLGDEAGGLVRAYGVRELVTGVGLLNARDATPWLWARVAGDALDLATLAPGLRGRHRTGATVALAAVAGVALLDLACARRLSTPAAEPAADYSRRSGWPLPAQEMRGAALPDFRAPQDMRIPDALRPWNTDESQG